MHASRLTSLFHIDTAHGLARKQHRGLRTCNFHVPVLLVTVHRLRSFRPNIVDIIYSTVGPTPCQCWEGRSEYSIPCLQASGMSLRTELGEQRACVCFIAAYRYNCTSRKAKSWSAIGTRDFSQPAGLLLTVVLDRSTDCLFLRILYYPHAPVIRERVFKTGTRFIYLSSRSERIRRCIYIYISIYRHLTQRVWIEAGPLAL